MPLPATISPLRREHAGDIVYTQIRDWIVHGPLEPGEIIRDGEIAVSLGVSRTPVREAILRLEHDGLVEMASGRWTRVAPLRLAQAPDQYRVVAALDALAAEQATPLLTGQDLAALADANEQLLRETSSESIHRADREFHRIYRRAAANDVVGAILDSLGAEIDRIERAYLANPGVPEGSYRGHQAIIAAFAARDAQRAGVAAKVNWLESIPRVQALGSETAPNARHTLAS